MSQLFVIHPDNPQPRLIAQAVNILNKGGVMVYPTDSGYAIGCKLENKVAIERIKKIRNLDASHHFTLVCRNLSEVSTYAEMDNQTFRALKANTPGAYTFILAGTKEVPKRLLQAKRKTIGIRIPDNKITQALLEAMGEPMMSVSLLVPEQDHPFIDARDILDHIGAQVDLIVDGGPCGIVPTTVVDLLGETPIILRVGKGEADVFKS